MKKTKIVKFISKGEKKKGRKKDTQEIIDHGKICGLNYEVYARGSVHIFDDKSSKRFKKDPALFEEALDELNLDSLKNGDEAIIEAAGDNPDLIFKKKDGDIQLSLRKKEYGTIVKLKNIIKDAIRKKKAI